QTRFDRRADHARAEVLIFEIHHALSRGDRVDIQLADFRDRPAAHIAGVGAGDRDVDVDQLRGDLLRPRIARAPGRSDVSFGRRPPAAAAQLTERAGCIAIDDRLYIVIRARRLAAY